MERKSGCFKNCFLNGLCLENPIFRLMLGLCPTLAVTVTVENGLGIGIAAIFVLLGSNIMVSLLKNFIPCEVRIPCYILIIATFVTIAKLILQAYFPQLYERLGLFVDIMVVNCIILGRAEAFACKNPVFLSIADALGMGTGFLIGTVTIGSIREILGSGKWFGYPLAGGDFTPAVIMVLPPGAFLTIGIIIAILNRINETQRKKINDSTCCKLEG